MVYLTSFSLEVNLLPLTKALWAQGIAHQVVEQGEEQQLWLLQSGQVPQAKGLCEAFVEGDLGQLAAVPRGAKTTLRPMALLASAPVTTGVLLLTLLVALMTALGAQLNTIAWLSFYQIVFSPEAYLLHGVEHLSTQPWRLLTPIWLHFGWLHLVFNGLWWWDLGRRIERHQSSGRLLLLLLLIGVASNLAQAWQGASLFGGLSGVIYGLLGYIWLWDRLAKPVFHLPQGVLIFMLIWLILGLTNTLSVVGFGNMANMAHLGGLLSGLAMALILAVIESRHYKR